MHKHNSTNCQKYLTGGGLKKICSENFLQIYIKTSMAKFILSKVPCFRHILLNIFRRRGLKYENYPLRDILFQTTFR